MGGEVDPDHPAVQAAASQIVDLIMALDQRCDQLERRVNRAIAVGAALLAVLTVLAAGAIATIAT
jgi:hypothetical protein